MATTTHCEPKRRAHTEMSSGSCMAAELSETLSAPADRSLRTSFSLRMPPPMVKGMKSSSAQWRASSTMVSRFSCEAVMSRKTTSSAPSAS